MQLTDKIVFFILNFISLHILLVTKYLKYFIKNRQKRNAEEPGKIRKDQKFEKSKKRQK